MSAKGNFNCLTPFQTWSPGSSRQVEGSPNITPGPGALRPDSVKAREQSQSLGMRLQDVILRNMEQIAHLPKPYSWGTVDDRIIRSFVLLDPTRGSLPFQQHVIFLFLKARDEEIANSPDCWMIQRGIDWYRLRSYWDTPLGERTPDNKIDPFEKGFTFDPVNNVLSVEYDSGRMIDSAIQNVLTWLVAQGIS